MPKLYLPLSEASAREAVAAVEAAITAGAVYPLPRGSHARSAMHEAAKALGIPHGTMRNRIARAGALYGLHPAGIPLPSGAPTGPRKAKAVHLRDDTKMIQPPRDHVTMQRLRDDADRMKREMRDLARRTGDAENLRRQVFGLVSDPLPPVSFTATVGSAAQSETIVLFLSDLHWGELIDLAAMDGLNSYSLVIARARLQRWAQAVVALATEHWSGPPPERILLILGGDLVSGEIHAELAKSNEALALPAVRDLVAHLTAAIKLFRSQIGCPVEVLSIPGNHGRTTFKPESKASAANSYDTLVADFLEATLDGHAGVTFYKPVSGDAVFSVYNWTVFVTHGDRIGSRGGTGFIGPAATAARGFKRISSDYSARGILLDLIIVGHFHTPLMLEEGFVNGSLPGPSEYSRDGRFRPHPAQQLFFTMHPRRKIAQVRWIDVGAPEEGALYAGPPDQPRIRPRYRVPAVTGGAA